MKSDSLTKKKNSSVLTIIVYFLFLLHKNEFKAYPKIIRNYIVYCLEKKLNAETNEKYIFLASVLMFTL